MSKITTLSSFWYGITITNDNKYLDFDEGGPILYAVLPLGDYTHTEFKDIIKNALRTAGTQEYQVSLNRVTRKFTISAPLVFNLRPQSGPHNTSSAYELCGFDSVDKTTLNTYTSDNASAYEYITQYPVNNYTSVEHSPVKENSSVNVSAAGVTQVVYFGEGARPTMNIRVITNKTGIKNDPFYENINGITDALELMNYLTTKAKIEFMPDKDAQNSFHKLILESTADSRDGTDFVLKNMDTPDFYETGRLIFRKVIV